MSTQAAQGILFTHATPQQGFKLLELPSELVELISNEAPILELKSPPPSQAQSQSEFDEAPDYVHLCTPDKTYQVRQVQSSNSLHILRPSTNTAIVENEVKNNDDDDMDMDMDMNTETMTSIANCGSTLELFMPKEGFSAVPFLVKTLGFYLGSEDREDVDVDMADDAEGEYARNARNAMNALFADIPVSKAQCEQGWVELCAFVFHSNSSTNNPGANCWRPSATVKVDVWKRVVEGAVLQGINLEQQFLVKDLWKSVLDDNGEEPFPRGLFEAVLRRVCEADSTASGAAMQWANIEKPRCIQWIGETYLEAKAPTAMSALGRSEFLNAWKDHLPESWRSEVAFSKLPEGSYKLPDPTSICFVHEGDRQKLKKNLSTDASAATTAKKSRNWHELFKNQRRR
ncbi:putative sister chromatid cohesion protein Dcc1 [Aspergillus ruber CBS 135680]|uniref:Sister chromatid cohesion protein Dcc1 n=1 Tax=Aspergillus ruber (strain CBS 135680) TaxID=1388766 RepID=A0A017SI37_ASPRC|nr:uncharacterized protein EURHEDRAFT_452848 [Aspergillus ruber CBS 135680]EYE96617.1 hypothetical protein EURHEDRAFT_452848 [Aspergillus ruber CBS 135680]